MNKLNETLKIKDILDFTDSPVFEHSSTEKNTYKVKQDWNVPKYTVSQINQSYRVINHWCDSGLIDGVRDGEKGWRKFNLYDVVWLKIIGQLRNMGLSIDVLKITRNTLISDQNEILRYMTAALVLGRDIEIIVYPDGRAFFTTKKFKLKLEVSGRLEKIYISLSLNSFLQEIFGEKYNPPLKEPSILSIENGKEQRLFQAILSGEYQEIQIAFKDGKVDRFKTSQFEKINEKALVERLKEFDFGNLSIAKQAGKITTIKKVVMNK